MPDFYDVLKTRRSVRSYAPKPVDEEALEELIRLATYAPSGRNQQPWGFTVVTNKELLSTLNARIKVILGASGDACFMDLANSPDYSIFYDAPALIAITGDTQVQTAMIDCQLAAENLFLAAHAKGLGTCYMGLLLLGREDAEVRRLLRLPAGRDLMSAAVIGHPVGPLPPPRPNPAQIEWVG